MPSATSRNTEEVRTSSQKEPVSGTSNSHLDIATDKSIPPMPSTKYGISFPSRISPTVTGVTISASIVPRSHSRAITIAVNSAPISVMITTTRPGTRKFRLRTPELNHTRCSTSTGASKR